MKHLSKQFNTLQYALFIFTAMACIHASSGLAKNESKARTVYPESDQDLTIKYYNRELTPEGVLRESNYEEKMLRRSGHVWTYRVLAPATSASHNALAKHKHKHKGFNYIVLPRHVSFDGEKTTVAFVNSQDKQVIRIEPVEYENINFDGSWINTYYLVDPQAIAALPVSTRTSAIAHAHWHEQQKNGRFQRVLWDNKKAIPLIIESGNQNGSYFQRISITPNAILASDLPWLYQQGYVQKEYADFLD